MTVSRQFQILFLIRCMPKKLPAVASRLVQTALAEKVRVLGGICPSHSGTVHTQAQDTQALHATRPLRDPHIRSHSEREARPVLSAVTGSLLANCQPRTGHKALGRTWPGPRAPPQAGGNAGDGLLPSNQVDALFAFCFK